MNDRKEAGFSYIDVMIGLIILMVGVLALMSAISASLLQTRGHEQQLIAKQAATSAMESIMSVKETDAARLGWIAVGNVGSNLDANNVPRGIFLTGFQSVFINAGADEVVGTADDNGATTPGLQRQIVITDLCDPDRPSSICPTPGTAAIRFRSVAITVRYNVGALQRQEILTTVLTDYSVTN